MAEFHSAQRQGGTDPHAPQQALKIDWATRRSAEYACKHWHYSKVMPMGKLAILGVWESEKFIGCVIFGRGANRNIGAPFGLAQENCVELVRVALRKHAAPVSRIVSISIKLLKRQFPGIKLIVSYADPKEGHIGGIYQAGNWVYTGPSGVSAKAWYKGRWVHMKSLYSIGLDYRKFPVSFPPAKHRYVMPLDNAVRLVVDKMRKPYPKKGDLQSKEQEHE